MELSSNKRLTRICNVIDQSEWIRNLQRNAIESENSENQTAGMEKLKRESYRCVAYNPSCLPFEKRLEKLKKWDDYLYRTEGLNELLRFLECVHAVENSVNALESKLYERGIEIDEKMFRDLCEGKLEPKNFNLRPDRLMEPICSSTPEREITPKAFIKEEKMNFISSSPSPSPTSSSSPSPSLSHSVPAYISQMLNKNPLSDMVEIGPNGTCISKKALKSINWSQTGANITRKLLMEIFDRQTLASHTLSGKPSPAFLGCNKPLKQQLDEKRVRDLTFMVTNTFNMSEKEVRQAITTKCADENKMYRQRMEKIRKKLSKENQHKKN